MTDEKTFDLTPTWRGILPGLLAVIANGETVEARKAAEAELAQMARLADAYVGLVQRGSGDTVGLTPDEEVPA